MSAEQSLSQSTLPPFLYGTAWKEERTKELAQMALAAGFRGIATANQRKHYVEAALGEAIVESSLPRSELFLQTNYTYARGQDHRLPYDPQAAIADQVRQSCERSLEHLRVEFIDSYLRHGPWANHSWGAQDSEAWQAMAKLLQEGKVKSLGVSNVSAQQLAQLLDERSHSPTFVQNRCYARTGWDHDVRAKCRKAGVIYQGFSLLTANRDELSGPIMSAMAKRLGKTVPQLVFCFARKAGMLPLTGTTSLLHMREDLARRRGRSHEQQRLRATSSPAT